jgi:hypothetical protein
MTPIQIVDLIFSSKGRAKGAVLLLIGFTLSLTTPHSSSIDLLGEKYQEILRNPNFLLFRRGDYRAINQLAGIKDTTTKRVFGSAQLHPLEYFSTEAALAKENVRSLFRGYLRSFHQKDYIVAPPTKYPTLQNYNRGEPVLHFMDGENNHHLLKRRSDDVFDLVLLEYSSIFDQYSGKQIENFGLRDYIDTARLAGNTLLKIAIYQMSSFDIPRMTHLEVPISPVSMVKLLAKAKEVKKANQTHSSQEIGTRAKLSAEEKSNRKIQSLMAAIDSSREYESKKLQEKRELVEMRLPHLKARLAKMQTLEDITVLVQGEIIRQIYDPAPVLAHCPGKRDENRHCYPSGNWDNRTWKLYRKLYKIPDVAGEFYHNY